MMHDSASATSGNRYIRRVSWKRALSAPLADKYGNELRTLNDARAYMIAIEKRRPGTTGRRHWRAAGEKLIAAAEGNSTEAATNQLTLALLMDGLLDMRK
jgi:hypothetical protein